ncbi:MAG: SusD/RagB family nutrient-binding outer membrane lipoprotein [Bacteroidales bacterium]|nr:SusD/RagB family nutrient-binding outer membrane lipoprotein [Bacteroidales bacterium]
MKKYIFNLLLIISFSLYFTSCEKWIDPEINIDPDSPEDPTMDLILPAAQAEMGYALGGMNIAGVTSMWMRYIVGQERQAKLINDFVFVEKDANSAWYAIYSNILKDLSVVIEKSKKEGMKSPYYEGVAKILMAFTYGTATQLWGDIPFSEALQGDDNLNPVYDSQEDVYEGIQQLLDEAILALSAKEDSNYYELTGDMIYENDIEKWMKVAHSLKLRYWLHLSKVKGSGMYQQILDYYLEDTSRFFTSNDDNFQFYFGENNLERNPMYQFDEQRNDCSKSDFFETFITTDLIPPGLINVNMWRTGFYDGETFAGNMYGDYNSVVNFMNYSELLFIIAEARTALDLFGNARSTLISAEMACIGDITDFLKETRKEFTEQLVNGIISNWNLHFSNTVQNIDDEDLFEAVMNYKYIAMFLNPEAYVDWRRTGYPVLYDLETEGEVDEVPRRFPYASEERLYNDSIPDITSIYARNWFDPK